MKIVLLIATLFLKSKDWIYLWKILFEILNSHFYHTGTGYYYHTLEVSSYVCNSCNKKD